MKRYAIIIPCNKEAYIKGFDGREKMAFLITDKVGSKVRQLDCSGISIESVMMAEDREKSQYPINDRATYLADIPEHEDLHGSAMLLGAADGEPVGYTLEDAETVKSLIVGLRW